MIHFAKWSTKKMSSSLQVVQLIYFVKCYIYKVIQFQSKALYIMVRKFIL